jgi:hypothetical protein
MDTKTAPLFPVASFPARTPEENVKLLGTVAHVCEVKGSYALVHASPVGVGRIAQELSLEVYPSRQGGEYYAVRVARSANVALVRSAPVVDDCPVPAPEVLPQRPVPQAPASAPRRTVVSKIGSTLQLEFKGQDYQVKETTCKRRCDVRRWEVRKLDGTLSDPYVVTFQDAHGDSTACSCPDAIYRKRFCKHQAGIKAAFGYKEQGQVLAG